MATLVEPAAGSRAQVRDLIARKSSSHKVRYIRHLDQIEHIPEAEREVLRRVAQKYAFRANDYYIGLIDWHDPADPIRQIVIPHAEELSDWGKLDASNEASVTVARGVQHKYPDTVLLLCNETCGAYCRYCFRKHLRVPCCSPPSLALRMSTPVRACELFTLSDKP